MIETAQLLLIATTVLITFAFVGYVAAFVFAKQAVKSKVTVAVGTDGLGAEDSPAAPTTPSAPAKGAGRGVVW
ncbi:MAG: hypothetical protein GX596_09560, partial [Propionibacterium sp.]|nr:hypothetical protein [Propionibacterium sp.]